MTYKYETIYKNGINKGYSVTNARTYLSNDTPVVATTLKTPYVNNNGVSVTGYADVPVTNGRGLRDSCSVEFFVDGHNLDYDEMQSLFTKDGGSVNLEDARKEMGQFAAAASEYSHVEMFDDWKQLQERNYKRFKIDDEPTEDDYERYLTNMEQQLMSSDFMFVGQITSRSDLNIARQSMPSFGQMMDDMQVESLSIELE